MKAWVRETYGGPEVLRLQDEPVPSPKAGEVLIRVIASSVNPADWHVLRGEPVFARATIGLFKPKHRVLGADVAGTVDAVGSGVTAFRPGDAVYANLLDEQFGGFAEFTIAPVTVVAPKPAALTFEEAAAVPMAAITALQGFRAHGPIRPGQRVLVNGASSGVGHFAVQLAKAAGADVTGVTSTRNIDLVRSFGADRVIDYTKADFTITGPYDRILDAIGNRGVAALRRTLAPDGACAVTGFTVLRKMLGVALRGGKRIRQVNAKGSAADLVELAALADSGKLRPAIDRTYPFAEVPAAIAYLETLRARGKVVVTMPG